MFLLRRMRAGKTLKFLILMKSKSRVKRYSDELEVEEKKTGKSV